MPANSPVEGLSEAIFEHRLMRGWSQIDLYEATGVRKEIISRIENGQIAINPATLQRLAKGLGIPTEDFFPLAAAHKSSRMQLSKGDS